jgi:DsbC/DsbD-like thiol-disulfide interchange protein
MKTPALGTLIWLSFATAAVGSPADTAAFDHSKVRIFVTDASQRWNAGLEIALAPGWKTYWRIPGESGVPPRFDWSSAANVKSVDIGWPAPERFEDESGETIGYAGDVVIPLHVEPLDPAKPMTLSLKLSYAACEKICVPALAEVAVDAAPGARGDPSDVARVASFAERIPSAPAASAVPSIAGLSVAAAETPLALAVTLNGSLPAAGTDIFVEGDPLAYFRRPRPEGTEGSASRFLLRVDGLEDSSALRGKSLTLTLVSGDVRLVQTLTVD